MLLPVLSRAKDTAARTTDINNLKEMMVATQLYATDNQDTMPWPNWVSGDEPARHGWLYTQPDNVVVLAPGQSAFKVETGLLWATLHNPKLYFVQKITPTAHCLHNASSNVPATP